MDRLRPRNRETFSGFTKSEIEKMEKLLDKPEESFSKDFCVKLAKGFNRSSGRAGKPIVKWQEVQDWLQKRLQERPNVLSSNKVYKNATMPASPQKIAHDDTQLPKGEEKTTDLSEIEFEAKSAKDGAWYDVEMFLAHRYVDSGEVEVLVRFVGFGAEEDEWINVKNAVRERSVPLESSECHKVKVGDVLLCFQERRDRAIHYDARVIEIQRRMHDIRGCRCLFLIEYLHDNSKERVRLRRLCSRPTW